jgi:GNAT superfamily N-acetyltransferase
MTRMIRSTTIHDVSTLLSFIRELAKYEELEHEVVADEQLLAQTLFGSSPQAEAILVLEDNTPVGFALFFSNYSTFLGKAGIHLEDLFVLETHRGRGHGKALLERMQAIAQERGAGRLEWNVLDWNQPAIDFYQSMGAKPVSGWTTYRMTWS